MHSTNFLSKTLGFFSLSRIPFLNRFSLRTKLVFSFLFVVLAGGILSSLIGTQLVADTIILQAQNKVKHDLSTAWLVYNESLNRIQDVVQLTALGRTIPEFLQSGQKKKLQDYLVKRRKEFGLDVLTLTDARGVVLFRSYHPFQTGDSRASDPLVQKALQGKTLASTWIVPAEEIKHRGYDLSMRNPFREEAKDLPKPIELTARLLEQTRELHDIIQDLHDKLGNGEE